MAWEHLDSLPEVQAAKAAAAACSTLAELRMAILAFDAHPLAASTPAVPGVEGIRCPKQNILMILGKSPAADETAQGVPFRGKAAITLREGFAAAGFDADAAYHSSASPWRPRKDHTPNATQIAFSRPFVMREIELLRPAIILALGRISIESLLGPVSGMDEVSGTEVAYVADDGTRIPMRLSYNHAAVMRDPRLMPGFIENLQTADRIYPGCFHPAQKANAA